MTRARAASRRSPRSARRAASGSSGADRVRTLARAHDKAEIVDRLRRLRPDSARRWGSMSASGMVCHVTDAFRLLVGEKPARDRSTLLRRTFVKWIALYAPLPWPADIRTIPEFDQRSGGTPPAEFAADVARLEALLERITTGEERLDGLRHPLFGRMSERDWLRWGYLHADHHLRQFGA